MCIHHAVFALEAGSSIVVDDELEGFVVPAVGAVAMPEAAGAFFQRDGGGFVEADDEGGGFNVFEGFGVYGRGCKEVRAGFDTLVSREGCDGSDGWRFLFNLVYSAELVF